MSVWQSIKVAFYPIGIYEEAMGSASPTPPSIWPHLAAREVKVSWEAQYAQPIEADIGQQGRQQPAVRHAFVSVHTRCIFSRGKDCSSWLLPAPSGSRCGSPVSSLVTLSSTPYQILFQWLTDYDRRSLPTVRHPSASASAVALHLVGCCQLTRRLASSGCAPVPGAQKLSIGPGKHFDNSLSQRLSLMN